MKIALIGYGRMGKAIEKIAINRKHEIVCILDKNQTEGELSHADVAITFSIPSAAVENITKAFEAGVPVVCGTTGWLDQIEKIYALCKQKKSAFLYASNFSVGVNLFFKLNRVLAQLMQGHEKEYSALLEETHHVHKLDEPSGTAITLAEGMGEENPHYRKWTMNPKEEGLPIKAYREGEVPGTHSITYASEIDQIQIEHKAHSREGFALGAVIAAEWINGKEGIFTMNDVLNL